MSVQIGDLIYNFVIHKVGWLIKEPANKSVALWTIEYADGKIERHTETAIRMFKKVRENALQRSKKNI